MNYLAVSSAWLMAFGRGYPDLVGRNHYDVHPDLPEAWKVVNRLALGGKTVRQDQEERWVRADGVEHWLRWTVLPWYGDDQEVGGIIIAAEDVTVERALRLSEARLSGIVSVSADAIVSVHAERNVTLFNQGAERIFGYADSDRETCLDGRSKPRHRVRSQMGSGTDNLERTHEDAPGLRRRGASHCFSGLWFVRIRHDPARLGWRKRRQRKCPGQFVTRNVVERTRAGRVRTTTHRRTGLVGVGAPSRTRRFDLGLRQRWRDCRRRPRYGRFWIRGRRRCDGKRGLRGSGPLRRFRIGHRGRSAEWQPLDTRGTGRMQRNGKSVCSGDVSDYDRRLAAPWRHEGGKGRRRGLVRPVHGEYERLCDALGW